ncbi:MAG: hypothetical protein KA321_02755 [Pseudomonadales bacterium]|nr:hypothetical protein [Pseudomonadales bacterium]
MSQDDFERIQPATLDIAAAPVAAAPQARAGHARLHGPGPALALGLLLMIAAGVIFVLPGYLAERRTGTANLATATPGATATPLPTSGSGSTSAAPAPAPAPAASAAPYEQAQAERERAGAKSALDALLAAQYELQQRAVDKWAAAEFDAATALAKAGDEAYRANDFTAAEAKYGAGQQAMQALLDGVDARLQDRLARGDAALTAGDASSATSLFTEALAIDAADARAQRGLARAGTLDRVLALMERASAAQAAGDTGAAAAAYREALTLDAGHEAARSSLAALQQRIATANYTARLSAGYAALAAGRHADARREFQAALALQPGGAEARDGLQQAEFQLAQQRLAELLDKAARAAGSEQWEAAVRHYDAALAIDAALGAAREGKQQAGTRLALDQALEQLAREPARLNHAKTRTAAEKLIAGATAIAAPGPRLQAQLASARRLLADYSTPVAVRLRSDGKTEVTVFRVGSFGPIDEKTLDLLPGDYVAVGQRDGYRDVRVEFSVRAGQAGSDVIVQCQQKI